VAHKDRPRHLNEYVDMSAHCPIREDDIDLSTVSWSYDPSISEYAQGKRQIERYLQENLDFPSVVMRVPATVGPEDPSLRFWWYMQRVLDGREIILRDGGSNIFRNGFRDDIAQAFVDAMDCPMAVNEIYNICQEEIVTLRRFVEVVAEQSECELNVVSVPGDAAETLSDLPWENWRFDPFSRPPAYVMSIEKARRDFGLKSTPMAEWVRQTVDWYRERHNGENSRFYERRDDEVAFARRWQKQYGQFIESLAKSKIV
jgi:nucleoside-diphosphate-sugar epimerase